ncbi:Hypothetical protein PACV_137 [Pacmanvirus A23]|uniref:Hypothetical protein n=1 Tax=Pacmanvirus A23 TaxID=1932881 RepID=UPI000A093A49|nr:Hypothetical protein B9W72_gp135 [Pacmanvirus A23]SIP85852.1 Hypothetical protein PACV_137 [Pacmanvirus A23]
MQNEISLDRETWKENSPSGEPITMNGSDDKTYQVHMSTMGTTVENLGVIHTTVLIYKDRYEIKTNMHCQIIKDDFIINGNNIHIDLEFSAKYDLVDLLKTKLVSINDSIAHINFSMGGFLSSTHGATFNCKIGDVCINHIVPINISNNNCVMKLKANYTIYE